MYNDISKPPPPLPTPELSELQPGTSLLQPLSRRGVGPGMIVLTSDFEDPLAIIDGVPCPPLKWAEEGYTVVAIQAKVLKTAKDDVPMMMHVAVKALERCKRCEPKDKIGIISYEPELWNIVAPFLARFPSVAVAAVYAQAPSEALSHSDPLVAVPIPFIRHYAGKKASSAASSSSASAPPVTNSSGALKKDYYYPSATSYKFATPFQDAFHYNTENVSHTRTLTLFKDKMGGPLFDLEAIWEEHTFYEFADRSMEHTMSTMVQEPYVNHVPTMTGGVGRVNLSHFYQHSFIFQNAADSELELISRTTGVDRVVDEFIFKFTHDAVIDWILPGVPPTNKKVEIPFTAVVNFRGDRLYHEHIAWDQGSVLRQIGLLPEYLPFPYPLPDGHASGNTPGKRIEFRVPVGGVETAQKMRDRNSEPSNSMFGYEIREV
ncbi:hypothetical protein BD289DRAFT_83615 [Coniella lustricola]|uniref:Carboxymethylenebutenolidase n=1 Tax=Coniella lustricola TaxID=2025994 RepID=A0A2T3AHD3_9PEZI|nr:hypothetical protein BD289DRAFT_83615 [Coniella lustricola]